MPPYAALGGDLLVAIGWLAIFFVWLSLLPIALWLPDRKVLVFMANNR